MDVKAALVPYLCRPLRSRLNFEFLQNSSGVAERGLLARKRFLRSVKNLRRRTVGARHEGDPQPTPRLGVQP
jgi:hypothetical protein